MSVSRGILENKYIEPYFYCRCGGVGPICSDCKRNHHNTRFETIDITTWYDPNATWYDPNVFGEGAGCLDYIKLEK